MDNAGSTNKNFYFVAFMQEMVQQKLFDHFRLSFMIAGHTKFSVDRLFSHVAITYNRSDVFNMEQLISVVSQHAKVNLDEGDIVQGWREIIGKKYTSIPGIRSYHDIIAVRHIQSDEVILRVRNLCYSGNFTNLKPKLVNGASLSNSIIPVNCSYKSKDMCHELSATKLKDMKQMYSKFIARPLWPEWVQ